MLVEQRQLLASQQCNHFRSACASHTRRHTPKLRSSLCWVSALLFSLVVAGCSEDGEPSEQIENRPQSSVSSLRLSVAGAGFSGLEITSGGGPVRLVAEFRNSSGELDSSASGVELELLNSRTFEPSTIASMGSDASSMGNTTLSLSSSTSTGVFEAFVECGLEDSGPFLIDALEVGGERGARALFYCTPPDGRVSLEYTQECESISSRLGSFCTFEVAATLAGVFPRPNVELRVNVQNATLAETSGATDATNDVLSLQSGLLVTDFGELKDSLTLITDSLGLARFYMYTPDDHLHQSVSLSLDGSDPDGRSIDALTREVSFEAGVDRASLALSPSRTTIYDNDSAGLLINIEAEDLNGEPSSGSVTLSSNQLNGGFQSGTTCIAGASSATLEVSLVDGIGNALFCPGLLDVNAGDEVDFSITAQTHPEGRVDPIVISETIQVLRGGIALVEVSVSPETLESDLSEVGIISVSFLRDGAPVNGSVTLTLTQDAGLASFIDASLEVDTITVSLTSGQAQAQIRADSATVRGIVEFDVLVDMPAFSPPDDQVVTTGRVTFDRAPVLRSVVPLPVAGDLPIGTIDSTLANSVDICFLIEDDSGNAMDVSTLDIEFSIPESSDQTAVIAPQTPDLNNRGVVCVTLSGGAQPLPIAVRIDVEGPSGVLKSALSEAVPVVIGVPQLAASSLYCEGPGGVVHSQVQLGSSDDIKCYVTLVDRNSNEVEGASVQMRIEGGSSVSQKVTDSNGRAIFDFGFGGQGRASVDVRDWSFGIALPQDASDVVTGATFTSAEALDCFDHVSETSCNLVALCAEPGNEGVCPLPKAVFEEQSSAAHCWESGAQTGLEILSVISGEVVPTIGCTRTNIGSDIQIACAGEPSVLLENGEIDVVELNTPGTALNDAKNSYIDGLVRCGYPITCLLGLSDGFPEFQGDECYFSFGCFDLPSGSSPFFSGNQMNPTTCPESGLYSVQAIFTGQETMTDLDGNGIVSFDDLNSNGIQDQGEGTLNNDSWVDFPEPFLDKNNNCRADDYPSVGGRLPATLASRYTEEKSDLNGGGGNQPWGFDNELSAFPERLETNGVWDRSAPLALNAHVVGVESGGLVLGESCSEALLTGSASITTPILPDAPPTYTCEYGGGSRTSLCSEVSPGHYMAPSCLSGGIDLDATQESYEFAFSPVDLNGNCWLVSSDATINISLDSISNARLSREVSSEPLRGRCRYPAEGIGEVDLNRPWCQSFPNLGAIPMAIGLQLDCPSNLTSPETEVGAVQIEIDTSTNTYTQTIPVTTFCP